MPTSSLEDVLATVTGLQVRVVELEAENAELRRRLGDGLGQLLQAAVQ